MDWCRPGRDLDLSAAIFRLQTELPGWWWSCGSCHVSADATIGPDSGGPDGWLLQFREFDDGIDGDLPQPATVAQAVYSAIEKAKAAKARYQVAIKADAG